MKFMEYEIDKTYRELTYGLEIIDIFLKPQINLLW